MSYAPFLLLIGYVLPTYFQYLNEHKETAYPYVLDQILLLKILNIDGSMDRTRDRKAA